MAHLARSSSCPEVRSSGRNLRAVRGAHPPAMAHPMRSSRYSGSEQEEIISVCNARNQGWLEAGRLVQLRSCPDHLEHGFPRFTGCPGAGWTCSICSACLPIWEVLTVSAWHLPIIIDWEHAYGIGHSCLLYLRRNDLAKMLRTSRATAQYTYEQLAQLRADALLEWVAGLTH